LKHVDLSLQHADRCRRFLVQMSLIRTTVAHPPPEIDRGQEDDCSQKRHEQAGWGEDALICARYYEERPKAPFTERRVDDSGHDVEQHAPLRSHDRARRSSYHSTDHEPDDDVHKNASSDLAGRNYPGFKRLGLCTVPRKAGNC